jgi:phosphatidylglycerophosphatase A
VGRQSTFADRIAWGIATVGGVGLSPVVPGTAGSLVALALLFLIPFTPWSLAVTALAVAAVGIWAAGRTEAVLGEHDPRSVVVDEVAGCFIAALALPQTWKWLLAAFIGFRLLDVLKPFPVRQLQALPGGWGIVVDDLAAGAYTALALHLARRLLGG